MNFTERINADIKSAMLAKEKERLAALRDIKSKLLLEATSGGNGEVSEDVAMKICMKLHKQRIESAFVLRLNAFFYGKKIKKTRLHL